jgi:hypothetical protein
MIKLTSILLEDIEVKNPDYFLELLKINKFPESTNNIIKNIVKSVKARGNKATAKEYDMLQRLKSGNFKFSSKN